MPHPSLQELLNNATALPSIPRIVHQVLKELDNEDPNPAEAAAVLKLDPESVFEKDPSEWTSSNQVALFTL